MIKIRKLALLLILAFAAIGLSFFVFSEFVYPKLPPHRCNNFISMKSAPELNYLSAWEVKKPPRLFVESSEKYRELYLAHQEKSLQLELILKEDKSISCFRLIERSYEKYKKDNIIYTEKPEFTDINEYSPEIKEMINSLKDWKYSPSVEGRKIESNHLNVGIWYDIKFGQIVPLPKGSRDSFEINMSRHHGEEGTVFYVQIKNDGSVFYHGKVHVKTIGKREFKLNNWQIDELYRIISQSDVWSNVSYYANSPADTPTAGLLLKFGSEEKSFFHPDYTEFGAPYDVYALQQYIEEIPQIRELTGRMD